MKNSVITASREDTLHVLQELGLDAELVVESAHNVREEEVFDLHVSARGRIPNSFMVDGVLTHNSGEPTYIENMLKTNGINISIEDVFGVRDPRSSNWIKKPLIRYQKPQVAERFFDYVYKLEKSLPDKLCVGDDWYYVFDDTKENRKKVGDHFDKNYWRKTKKLRVPAPDGTPQALIVVDSYPAMLPERLDDEDAGAGMAAQARMFSEQIKRIKGRMSSKRIIIVGVNQLRQRPAVMYGCFTMHSKVLLADMTYRNIKEIVDNKLKLDVMSYNPRTGLMEPKPIVNWFDNGTAKRGEFLRFKFRDSRIHVGAGQKSDLKVTKNHLLMSGDGVLRRAFDFKPGDRLLQTGANLSLSPVQRQIVLGSVLGDGWFGTKLSQSGELVGVNVNFAHKEEHEEYLNWKAKILKPYICSIYGDNIITAEMRKIDEPWMFHLYEESKRGISHKRDYNLSPTLLRNIGPLGLAVWYMDDGRKIERKSSLIKMQSYTPEDAESIIDNINARFRTDLVFKTWKDKGSRKNGEGWGASVGEEFRKLVAPCMEKSMLSRLLLPNERKLWKPKLKDDHEQSLHTIEVEIEDITEETYSGHKYDLEVQDNHFYVVDGAIVENSPEYEPCGDALKFYCMTGDTVLYTEKGMLTAEEMERMYSTGTKTSMVGVSGREDCQFFSYKGHSQILRLHTKNGYQVKGKPGHAVLSLEKGSLERKFQKIEDLRPKGGTQGSYVAIKVGSNVWSSQNAKLSGFASYSCKDTGSGVRHLTSWKLPKVMNNDLGAVLGYLVGDGCIREGSIIFSSQEKQQTANFIRAFSGAFKVSEIELRKGANAKQVSLHNAEIAAFLAFCGCGSKSSWQKSIPWAVRQSKKSVVASFLSALFDCDGSAGKKSLSYSSVSTTLISQVHTALLNMGIVSKLELVERRFAHGYDKGGMHNTRPSTIQIFGHSYEKFFEEVGFCLDRKSALIATHMKGSNTSYDLVPQLSGYRKGISDRGLLILEQALGIGAGGLIRYRDFESKSWFKKALQLSAELRTQQERTKIRTELEAVKDLMDYTLKNGLYWVEVKGVSSYHEREATFDGNMPKTSTIVTNGIVSHNSDCRLRFNPRALSGVPYPVKGKGMVMEEPSVTVKKGKDQYRFIHVRATKNKLAMPYLETWIRLWIEDGNGDARGFDPVWDTFMYLDNTGQLSHKGMKKIVLKIKKHENAKPMEWLDFKTLIVGTKKQQKEVCERIGLKWFDLRAFTLEQLNKKDGMALFLEHKKSGGEREEGDDEEEGDDGDDAD